MKSGRFSGLTPTSTQKDPHNQKENVAASPFEKRRKVVCKDVFGVRQSQYSAGRPVFTSLQEMSPARNQAQAEPMASADSSRRSSDAENVPLSKEEIEALLNMKMAGKTKFDFKGKSEQQMDYIKKLRLCVRQLQEQESHLCFEKEQCEKQLEAEQRERETNESFLRNRQDDLEKGLAELQKMCEALGQKLVIADSEKEKFRDSSATNMEALKEAGKELTFLVEELDRSRGEVSSLTQQVASLQDLNKRLQEYNTSLQQYNSKMQADASTAAEAFAKSQKEKSSIMETLGSLRGHSAALQEQLDMVKTGLQEEVRQKKISMEDCERLRADLQRLADERDQQAAQVQKLSEENARYKECTGKSAAELEFLSSKAIALQECYTSQAEQVKSLRQQLDVANHKLQITEDSYLQERTEVSDLKARLEDATLRLTDAEIRVQEGEQLRRKLHNTIQELKGNIRVFCRVRPLFPEADDPDASQQIVHYPNTADLLGRGIELVPALGPRHVFSFDKVFGPEAGQATVFAEISQLVQSALDGYKVCIFAYGQTGSGKTHTMLGNSELPDERGVIPRSLEQIFKSSQELTSRGWSFRMQASMLEIYNEQIRDLLGSGRISSELGTPMKHQQYQVKHDQNGNTYVTDLTLVDVTTWEEVSSLLHKATQSRSVGKTAVNEQSSRSHCVFTLRILGTNESTEQKVNGVLNLIDLAGSERLSRSGSTGDRLRETQAINKSLASLGDVIAAIANKEQHIPYRNSKLTYLLQPCLGGDSKTLMFVNLAPDAKSLHESLCSLRFAAKVNACEIGVPRRQAGVARSLEGCD